MPLGRFVSIGVPLQKLLTIQTLVFVPISNCKLNPKNLFVDQCYTRNYCTLNMEFHAKARSKYYPNTNNKIQRLEVPDDKVLWTETWNDYSPPNYTLNAILGKPWADPDISDRSFNPQWNQLDGKVNRVSYEGDYAVVDDVPRNPRGRTGLSGRGCLGRWGPNHAADPIVTRWKRDCDNTIVKDSSSDQPILQFIAIKRRDNQEWAIPGGMVDPGENISATLQREFSEEALNSLELSSGERKKVQTMVKEFFQGGIEVYRGYVDDPRNTDNAWMETVAVNFHDDKGDVVGKFAFQAGDDAMGICWKDLDRELNLYANHVKFLEKTAAKHHAKW